LVLRLVSRLHPHAAVIHACLVHMYMRESHVGPNRFS
jgi:hypothetical protein